MRDRELNGIASYPTQNNVFRVDSFADLGNIQENLLQAICNGKFYSVKSELNAKNEKLHI